MPAPRPSEFLTWNPSLSNVVDPPSGQKSSGWIGGQEPPAQFFNWIINLTDQWIQYFDAALGPIAQGLTTNNLSAGPVTVATGTSFFIPFLTIRSVDTYTVQSGAELVSVSQIIVNGVLLVSGIVRVL